MILDKIIAAREERIVRDAAQTPLEQLLEEVHSARTPQAIVFSPSRFHIIAEVKFASPSLGTIASREDPVAVARDYVANGAAMLSILTEPHYFKGNLDYLKQIRAALPNAILLMKDFITSEYQIAQARLAGADAILLIAAILTPERLRALRTFARHLKLSVLLEVHSAEELLRAIPLAPEVLGVNNRCLKTMAVNLHTSEALAKMLPPSIPCISESGLTSTSQLRALRKMGFRGALMGTALMRQGHLRGSMLRMLVDGVHADA